MSFFTTFAQQQTAQLSGTVRSESGEALAKATVYVTPNETVLTDKDGRYTIKPLARGRLR